MSATAAAPRTAGPSPARDRPRVGMVGAGQLARMTLPAAIALDVELVVLAASLDDPAVRAGAAHVLGAPDDLGALRTLAEGCDVVTFDHEVVPSEHLAALGAEGHVLRPAPTANRLAQDKAHQRAVLGQRIGVPVPAHRLVSAPAEVEAFAQEVGWPVVVKAPRGGYDGRGVWLVDGPRAAHEIPYGTGLLAEEHVVLERELAILVARRPGGSSVTYPVVETIQRDGMLRELTVPAPVPPGVAAEAQALAARVAEGIDATGVLAVELFVADGRLLVNELALRPHNSGHWSIEGAATSQFENHLRAVLDWPLGAAGLVAPAAATVNVVGPADGSDPRARRAGALGVAGAHVHLYGKEPRPGRKLGHVTALGPDPTTARAAAHAAAAILHGGAPA